MPNVLTESSKLTCAHQGKVQLKASQSVLKVNGHAVLVQGDLDGATISGCITPDPTQANPNSKKCNTIVAMTAGAATKLKVGNKPVLLDTAMGMTDGLPVPANTWSVQSAGQTKLESS